MDDRIKQKSSAVVTKAPAWGNRNRGGGREVAGKRGGKEERWQGTAAGGDERPGRGRAASSRVRSEHVMSLCEMAVTQPSRCE